MVRVSQSTYKLVWEFFLLLSSRREKAKGNNTTFKTTDQD